MGARVSALNGTTVEPKSMSPAFRSSSSTRDKEQHEKPTISLIERGGERLKRSAPVCMFLVEESASPVKNFIRKLLWRYSAAQAV
jgi:hypothetical protein